MMPLLPHIPGMLRGKFFIDKCCVSQDAESQLMMIRQLRSTLISSKRMILLWQPEYFDSLACVHELATFLNAHKDSRRVNRVNVVPVCIPLLTAALFLFHVVATAAIVFLSPLTVFSEWHMEWVDTHIPASGRYVNMVTVYIVICFSCLYLVPSFLLWRFANFYMKQRRQLQEQLSNFRVVKSKCFLEAHRQALMVDIAAQFGSVEAFERFIQNELPQEISVLRQAPVPLFTAMVGAISHLFLLTSIISSALRQGESEIAVNAAIALPMNWLGTDSLALNLVCVLAGRMLAAEKPISRACKRLLGPLASSMIFASVSAVSVDVTVLPIWGMFLIMAGILAMVGFLYRQDYFAGAVAGGGWPPAVDSSPAQPSSVDSSPSPPVGSDVTVDRSSGAHCNQLRGDRDLAHDQLISSVNGEKSIILDVASSAVAHGGCALETRPDGKIVILDVPCSALP
jgi:hypothetical protein